MTFHGLAPELTRMEVTLDVDAGSLIEKAARGMRRDPAYDYGRDYSDIETCSPRRKASRRRSTRCSQPARR